MKHPFRIFGSAIGISAQAFEACRDHLAPFANVKHSDQTLTFDHEGTWLDVENISSALAEQIDPDGVGTVDVVDNDDWVLTRYLISPGKVSIKTINLNDATDKYLYE